MIDFCNGYYNNNISFLTPPLFFKKKRGTKKHYCKSFCKKLLNNTSHLIIKKNEANDRRFCDVLYLILNHRTSAEIQLSVKLITIKKSLVITKIFFYTIVY